MLMLITIKVSIAAVSIGANTFFADSNLRGKWSIRGLHHLGGGGGALMNTVATVSSLDRQGEEWHKGWHPTGHRSNACNCSLNSEFSFFVSLITTVVKCCSWRYLQQRARRARVRELVRCAFGLIWTPCIQQMGCEMCDSQRESSIWFRRSNCDGNKDNR